MNFKMNEEEIVHKVQLQHKLLAGIKGRLFFVQLKMDNRFKQSHMQHSLIVHTYCDVVEFSYSHLHPIVDPTCNKIEWMKFTHSILTSTRHHVALTNFVK